MVARGKDARTNSNHDYNTNGDNSFQSNKIPLESQRHCNYYYNSPNKNANTSVQQQQYYSQDDPSLILLDSVQSVKDAVDAWDKEFYNKPIPTIELSENENEDEKKNSGADAFRRFYGMDNNKREDKMKDMKNAYSSGGRTPSPLKKTPIRFIKGKINTNDKEQSNQQLVHLPSLSQGLSNTLKKRPMSFSRASPLRSNIINTGRDEVNQNKKKYGGSSSVERLEMKNTINGIKDDKGDIKSYRRSESNSEVGKILNSRLCKGQETGSGGGEQQSWKDCNNNRRFKEKQYDQIRNDGKGKQYQIYITNNVYGNEDIKKEKKQRKEEDNEEDEQKEKDIEKDKGLVDTKIVDRTDKIDRICKELLRNNENMINLAKEIDVFYGSDITGKGQSHRRKDIIYDRDSDSGEDDQWINRRNKEDYNDRWNQQKVEYLKDIKNKSSEEVIKKNNMVRNGQSRRRSCSSESDRDSEGDLSESQSGQDGEYGKSEQQLYTTPLRDDDRRIQKYLQDSEKRDIDNNQEDNSMDDALMLMKYPILERNSGQSSNNFKKIQQKRQDEQTIQVGQIQSYSGLSQSSSQGSSRASTLGSTSKKELLVDDRDELKEDYNYPGGSSKWKYLLEKVQEESEKLDSNSECHQSMAVTNNEFYQEAKVDFEGNEEDYYQNGSQKKQWDEDNINLNPWMVQMMKQGDLMGQKDGLKNVDVDGQLGIKQRTTTTLGRRNPFLKIKK